MNAISRAVACAVPWIFASSIAWSTEPMRLSETELESVNAGATASATASGFAIGSFSSSTESRTFAYASTAADGALAHITSLSFALALGISF